MKVKVFSLALLCSLQSLASVAAELVADYKVVPLPQEIVNTDKKAFVLTASTPIVYTEGNADLQRDALFLVQYINEVTG